MLVKHRKTFIISKTLDSTGKFQENINVNFIPDEMRISQVNYTGTELDGIKRVVWTGLDDLFIFDSGYGGANVNVRVNVHRPINGLQQFEIRDVDNVLETGLAGELGFVFEFIKY